MANLSGKSGPRDGGLYNEDLAPIPASERKWGAFEIFNVWNNDIQSLFGYTLAASLFLSYGLNGWLTFAANRSKIGYRNFGLAQLGLG